MPANRSGPTGVINLEPWRRMMFAVQAPLPPEVTTLGAGPSSGMLSGSGVYSYAVTPVWVPPPFLVQSSDGGYFYVVEKDQFRSDLTIVQDGLGGSSISFVLNDPSTLFSLAMLGTPMLIQGGYSSDVNARATLFVGYITDAKPQFVADGQVYSVIYAQSNHVLLSQRIRSINYGGRRADVAVAPVAGTKNESQRSNSTKQETNVAPDPIETKRKTWINKTLDARGRSSLTLKQLIFNIATDYGFTPDRIVIALPPETANLQVMDIPGSKKPSLPPDEVRQDQESDWTYLQRLAAAHNCRCTIEQDLADDPSRISIHALKSFEAFGTFKFLSDEVLWAKAGPGSVEPPEAYKSKLRFLRHSITMSSGAPGRVLNQELVDPRVDPTRLSVSDPPIWQPLQNVDLSFSVNNPYSFMYYSKDWKTVDDELVLGQTIDASVDGQTPVDPSAVWELAQTAKELGVNQTQYDTIVQKVWDSLTKWSFTWDAVKPLWYLVREATQSKNSSTRRRFFPRGWQLTGTTFGNVALKPGVWHFIDGLGGYSGWWIIEKVTHILGDTYVCSISFKR